MKRHRSQRACRPFCAVMLGVALAACGAEGDRPGFTIFPDMMESAAYGSYEPNPVTPRGMTLMRPPDGTVPMGSEPLPYGPTEDDAIRAGRELVNPLTVTPAALARGRRAYESFCAVCHGTAGDGDGPIIGRFPNPPSLSGENARSYPDGRIFHVITYGQGLMPSHAIQVLPEARWELVHYVRQLQQGAEAVALPDESPADEAEENRP